jgi:hypothetical protein
MCLTFKKLLRGAQFIRRLEKVEVIHEIITRVPESDLVASKKTNLTVVVYVVYDNKQLVWGFAHRQCQGWTVAGESEDL